MNDFAIDYVGSLANAPSTDLEETIAYLTEELPWAWGDAYREMVGHQTAVHQFNDGSFEVLFDIASKVEISPDEAVEDRVVAIFGCSMATHAKRDASRMAGFLRGETLDQIRSSPDGEELIKMDRGHYLAHTLGGRTDVNLFPQRREVNRGWSERGKVYRSMERYCAAHPGTFCFSRPIYRDLTWIPFEIEYGVLRNAQDLWVERFEN